MSGSENHSLIDQNSSLSTVDLSTQNTTVEEVMDLNTPTPPRRYNLREPRDRRVPERYGFGQVNHLATQNPFYNVTNPFYNSTLGNTNPFCGGLNPFNVY